MSSKYKTHQWYQGVFDDKFYYYFWAIFKGNLLGSEYESDGTFKSADMWDDEDFTNPDDANFKKADKNWNPLSADKQEIVTGLVKVLWEYGQ